MLLDFSLEFELVSQLMMTKVRLLTFREPLIFPTKVEMCFMREEMELWTSFTSPRWLNTEFLSCAGDELEDSAPIFILMKTKGLGCLSPLNLQNTEDLGVLSFSIRLNTKGCCCGIDGCSFFNRDDFELGITFVTPQNFTY